jgi:hypothetical protein
MNSLTRWEEFKLKVLLGQTKLSHDALQFYKMGSIWVLTFIGASPDIYNGLASMGWLDQVPPRFAWVIRILSGLGIAVRVLKQRQRGAQ